VQGDGVPDSDAEDVGEIGAHGRLARRWCDAGDAGGVGIAPEVAGRLEIDLDDLGRWFGLRLRSVPSIPLGAASVMSACAAAAIASFSATMSSSTGPSRS
jgi:hypothetical protein